MPLSKSLCTAPTPLQWLLWQGTEPPQRLLNISVALQFTSNLYVVIAPSFLKQELLSGGEEHGKALMWHIAM